MTDLWLLLAFLPAAAILGFAVWEQVLSPAARGWRRAYSLGLDAGMDDAYSWDESPFTSEQLTRAWRRGLVDGREIRAERQDLKKLERDLELLQITARNIGNHRP